MKHLLILWLLFSPIAFAQDIDKTSDESIPYLNQTFSLTDAPYGLPKGRKEVNVSGIYKCVEDDSLLSVHQRENKLLITVINKKIQFLKDTVGGLILKYFNSENPEDIPVEYFSYYPVAYGNGSDSFSFYYVPSSPLFLPDPYVATVIKTNKPFRSEDNTNGIYYVVRAPAMRPLLYIQDEFKAFVKKPDPQTGAIYSAGALLNFYFIYNENVSNYFTLKIDVDNTLFYSQDRRTCRQLF